MSRGAGFAVCCALCVRIKYVIQRNPFGAWLILGAFGGNPWVAAIELLQAYCDGEQPEQQRDDAQQEGDMPNGGFALESCL